MMHKFNNKYPNIHEKTFLASSSDIIGDVILNEDSSVWFGAVLRGDDNQIIVGKGVNIQDNCSIHSAEKYPTKIGDYSNIGHNCVIHACKVGKECLIGMGSIILDGAEIGDNTIIGAGSLVTGGKKIPSGVLCVGSPAKVIRELTEEEKKHIMDNTNHYINLADQYK
ncbi:gamma carbonic anhydrase family protein [Clostridium ganghwense]|uniref:Gamma carbonic anhydrase family protein n=1 Tax=Clostridium ganghwense TaxID=312089 RepID=A0ABT4CS57_9CLOT|nr:gamma carbonic anhydrase family protein [Clostridium ganghwense]MCY6371905.1 gamma carbonic anhydrase family protein [Clostridium ganghwense]